MLSSEKFKGSELEHAAVGRLLTEHGADLNASVTRSEPGETGPLRVEVGGQTWIVEEDGTTQQESA